MKLDVRGVQKGNVIRGGNVFDVGDSNYRTIKDGMTTFLVKKQKAYNSIHGGW